MFISLRSTFPLLALVLAGCSGESRPVASVPTHAVTGKVLLANGSPLTTGQVVFVSEDPKVPSAYGPVGEDGTFTMGTAVPGDGSPLGQFKVRIESTIGEAPADPKKSKTTPPLFAPKYMNAATSGLTVTVKQGGNTLEPFQLK